ncbi:MAG: hypothetical protein MJE77_25965 [Proteobacteria bacterium]|nr:hypothetical protein [Pseudomonadota bacterium]
MSDVDVMTDWAISHLHSARQYLQALLRAMDCSRLQRQASWQAVMLDALQGILARHEAGEETTGGTHCAE